MRSWRSMLESDDTGGMPDSPPFSSVRCLVAVVMLGLPLLGGLAGCQDEWARDRDAAVMALERGDDRVAMEDARRIVRSGPRSMRPEAGYLGGVAAYRAGEYYEALDFLQVATVSGDDELRGKALLQRGTVEVALGRRAEAAASLERGGLVLQGSLGSEALARAADLYQGLGREVDARRCLDDARRYGGDAAVRGRIAGYTIQFGAFQSRANAEKCRRAISDAVRRASVGSLQVIEQDGLFKVQVGSFPNISQADRAKRLIRQPDDYLSTITAIGG